MCPDPEISNLLMVSHLKIGAPDLKFLTADGLTTSKSAPDLKFLTADGLTPQKRCLDPRNLKLLMVSHLKTGA